LIATDVDRFEAGAEFSGKGRETRADQPAQARANKAAADAIRTRRLNRERRGGSARGVEGTVSS
jgi:hypothetical protein